MLEQYHDVLTVAEASQALRIGKTKMYELIRSQTIQSIRIGRCIKIPKGSLLSYMSQDGII